MFISPAMNDAVKKLNECIDSGRLIEGTDAVTVANDLSVITKGFEPVTSTMRM